MLGSYSKDEEDITFFKEEITLRDEFGFIDVCTVDDIGDDSKDDFDEVIINSDSEDDSYVDVCDSEFEDTNEGHDTFPMEDESINVESPQGLELETNSRNDDTCEKNNAANVNEGSFAIPQKSRWHFRTKNKYKLYCFDCNRIVRRIGGRKITTCDICRKDLAYECKKCSKRYFNHQSLYLHLKNVCFANDSTEGNVSNKFNNNKTKGIRTFRTAGLYQLYCSQCNERTKKVGGYQKTICDICESLLKYECLKCKNIYNQYAGIYLHLRNKCAPSTLLINNSNEGSQSKNNENETSQKVQDEVNIYCKKCREPCADVTEMQNCEGEQVFQCYDCSFTCCHKSNFKQHISKHETSTYKNDKRFSIPTCSKDNLDVDETASASDSIKRAIKDDIEVHCIDCQTTLQMKIVLGRIEDCESCKKPLSYRCTQCKKNYRSPRATYNHLYFECDSLTWYKCDYCCYQSKYKGSLLTHMQRKHIFKKCSGCGQFFLNTIEFRNHKLIDCKKDAPFKCRDCSFETFYITQLKDHMRIEHKSKYRCKICSKKYTRFKSMKKHEDICGLELTFKCEHCSYVDEKKSNLIKHLRRWHPLQFD